jgi:hypothetical protein
MLARMMNRKEGRKRELKKKDKKKGGTGEEGLVESGHESLCKID